MVFSKTLINSVSTVFLKQANYTYPLVRSIIQRPTKSLYKLFSELSTMTVLWPDFFTEGMADLCCAHCALSIVKFFEPSHKVSEKDTYLMLLKHIHIWCSK